MIYADFEFYRDSYFGKLIPEEDFPRLSLRASQYIDYITQGRAAARAELEPVKMCCCELAEQYQTIETARELAAKSLSAGVSEVSDGAEVQSESVGSWSRSYRSSGDSAVSAAQAAAEGNAALLETARRHLTGTGLLYRGGRRCV